MKYQASFSSKGKSKKIKCCLLQLLFFFFFDDLRIKLPKLIFIVAEFASSKAPDKAVSKPLYFRLTYVLLIFLLFT